MADGENKYADRAERLRQFYESGDFGNKSHFSELLGIRNQHLNNYLTGKQDPVNLCVELIKLGCDIKWLITGERFSDTVSLEHRRILSELQKHNLDTLGNVTRLIRLDEANRGVYVHDELPKLKHPPKHEVEVLTYSGKSKEGDLLTKSKRHGKEK